MDEIKKKQLLSTLGLAKRAGKLAMGRTQTKRAMHAHNAYLILIASDISPALVRELNYLNSLEEKEIPVIQMDLTIAQIYFACAYKAGVIAVTDKNFSKKILNMLA